MIWAIGLGVHCQITLSIKYNHYKMLYGNEVKDEGTFYKVIP